MNTDPSGKDDLFVTAIEKFRRLADEAERRGEPESLSAALATCSADARPSVRTITVARITDSGLAFFVNTSTGKGRQLQANPRAAMCFHWPLLQHQVIVEGDVAPLDEATADALWRAMPRDFGVGHWTSDQTRAADTSATVKKRAGEFRRRFEGDRVPRNPEWKAFEIRPDRMDFWPTGWQRLRARECYSRQEDGTWARSEESP